MFANNGEAIPPCGVPVIVGCRPPVSVITPAFRNERTSPSTRLSTIRRRSSSPISECGSSSNCDDQRRVGVTGHFLSVTRPIMAVVVVVPLALRAINVNVADSFSPWVRPVTTAAGSLMATLCA